MPPRLAPFRALPAPTLRNFSARIAPRLTTYVGKSNHLILRRFSTELPGNTIKFTVERKFKPDDTSINLLRANNGTPPFSAFEYLGSHDFTEAHYGIRWRELGDNDPAYLGGRQDIYWVGQNWDDGRNMFVKMRCCGDNINGGYMEFHGEDEVDDYLMKTIGIHELRDGIEMSTKRETWRVEDYIIILDKTLTSGRFIRPDRVGVEDLHMTASLSWSTEIEEGGEQRMWEVVNHRMETFMQHHKWSFGPAPTLEDDKLAQCFEAQRWDIGPWTGGCQVRGLRKPAP
ncbi:hypothetical protein BDU57DRAFT_517411 [Ampelomyces quisqualis]|uniref:Uncharacterized protein n=1 Tax=Ampelomyces quisqualis TaxID=50730 RepID=A0A6A5QNP7_AMPQU|nr:hypothetical protein BDU57DRAFT_517411 [Ampelomyces quisqualis]